jgi:hypothetical protein
MATDVCIISMNLLFSKNVPEADVRTVKNCGLKISADKELNVRSCLSRLRLQVNPDLGPLSRPRSDYCYVCVPCIDHPVAE